MAFYVERLQR